MNMKREILLPLPQLTYLKLSQTTVWLNSKMDQEASQEVITFISEPLPPTHIPTSWLEMGLIGQAVIFRLQLKGRRITLIIQNPVYLAYLIWVE